MKNNSIITVGLLQPDIGSGKIHLQDYVYDSLGVAPTITARDYKDPRRILIYDTK